MAKPKWKEKLSIWKHVDHVLKGFPDAVEPLFPVRHASWNDGGYAEPEGVRQQEVHPSLDLEKNLRSRVKRQFMARFPLRVEPGNVKPVSSGFDLLQVFLQGLAIAAQTGGFVGGHESKVGFIFIKRALV